MGPQFPAAAPAALTDQDGVHAQADLDYYSALLSDFSDSSVMTSTGQFDALQMQMSDRPAAAFDIAANHALEALPLSLHPPCDPQRPAHSAAVITVIYLCSLYK